MASQNVAYFLGLQIWDQVCDSYNVDETTFLTIFGVSLIKTFISRSVFFAFRNYYKAFFSRPK